jgi:hypothetical protein
VLGGEWARTTRMESGEEYSAKEFYELWIRWLQNVGSAEKRAAARVLPQEVSGSDARFFTRDHRRDSNRPAPCPCPHSHRLEPALVGRAAEYRRQALEARHQGSVEIVWQADVVLGLS